MLQKQFGCPVPADARVKAVIKACDRSMKQQAAHTRYCQPPMHLLDLPAEDLPALGQLKVVCVCSSYELFHQRSPDAPHAWVDLGL